MNRPHPDLPISDIEQAPTVLWERADRFKGSTSAVKAFYTDQYPIPLPEGHRFPITKYARLRQRLVGLRDLELTSPSLATREEIRMVHSPDYIHRVFAGELSREDVRRLGLPWSPELVQRSLASVGGTLAACRAALVDGIAVTLSGGTHHAFADKPEGYCVFNDAVIAARVLQRDFGIQSIAIVDTDVHQGNGTASLVAGDSTIFAFSIHGANNFPFVKVPSDLDIALPDQADDEMYAHALAVGLYRLGELIRPDLVIFLAGADPFKGDRFSRLAISKTGLRRRDEAVLRWCEMSQTPVAVTMAGGYAPTIDDIVDIHESTVLSSLHHWRQGRKRCP